MMLDTRVFELQSRLESLVNCIEAIYGFQQQGDDIAVHKLLNTLLDQAIDAREMLKDQGVLV